MDNSPSPKDIFTNQCRKTKEKLILRMKHLASLITIKISVISLFKT